MVQLAKTSIDISVETMNTPRYSGKKNQRVVAYQTKHQIRIERLSIRHRGLQLVGSKR